MINGYDGLVEISTEALLALVRPKIEERIGVRFPAEKTVDLDDAAGGGVLHLVLTRLRIGFGAGEPPSLILWALFERASLHGNRFDGYRAGDRFGMSGALGVMVPFSIRPPTRGDPRERVLHLDVRHASATTSVSGPNRLIFQLIAEGVVGDVRAGEVLEVPLPVRVDRTGDSTLSPLVAYDVVAAPLRAASPEAHDALGLFLALTPQTRGDASPQRTAVATRGDVRVTLTRDAFRRLVIRPMLAKAFETTADRLPTEFGRAQFVSLPWQPELSVTRISADLGSGAIEVSVHVMQVSETGPFGNTKHADVTGRVTLSTSGDRLVTSWRTTKVSGGIEYGWGWWASTVLIGPAVIMAIGAIFAEAGASAAAGSIAPELPSIDLSVPVARARLRHVEVRPDAVTVTAGVDDVWFSPGQMAASITVSVRAVRNHVAESGVYESRGCPEGNFQYARIERAEEITLSASTSFASWPISYVWSIGGYTAPAELRYAEGASQTGTVSVEANATGGSPPNVRTESRSNLILEYEMRDRGSTLVLRNRPEDGSYDVIVSVTVVDYERRTVRATKHVPVTGHVIEFGHDEMGVQWADAVSACARAMQEELRQAEHVWRETLEPAERLGPADEPEPDPRATLGMSPGTLAAVFSGALRSDSLLATHLAWTLPSYRDAFLDQA